MPSNKNKIVVASAGSRKTTYIVEQAIENLDKKILIVAYTNNTLDQIKKYIIDRVGIVPSNIKVQSWHSFLLNEFIKPYQKCIYDKKRIDSIFYPSDGRFMHSRRFVSKKDVEKYYLVDSKKIVADHLPEFAFRCNEESGGLAINRLSEMYNMIFIDESQDLAGYDFHIVESLFESTTEITLVGDNRQATYFTNNSSKNKKYKGSNIIDLFRYWESEGLCDILEKNQCYRSNQTICDFADGLYPMLPCTESKEVRESGHDGIFLIKPDEVDAYVGDHSPAILRDTRRTKTMGLLAYNFGESKGKTFDRVLIFPNTPIRTYLKTGDESKFAPITRSKFYVAITRARHSVAIVYEGDCGIDFIERYRF